MHVVVHSLFSPDHLLLSRDGQIQPIPSRWDWFQSNRSKSQWFRIWSFLHYLINLLIKIINIWFLGIFYMSDGKITQNLEKVGLWVYMVLLAWKWAPPWLKLISEPTFITKPIFPIRLLKNSLSFVEKLKFKNPKKLKKSKS